MAREGIIGKTVDLGIKFYSNGVLFDPFNVATVKIYDRKTGGSIVATITPTRIDIGYYRASWAIPSSYLPTTYYDSWQWVAESGMESKTQRYSFSIVPESVSVEVPSIVRAEVGCRPRPSWEFYIGLRNVEDVGNGMGLRLSFGKAIPSDSDKLVHYNVYHSDTRFGVLDSWPKLITTEQQIIVNVTPGKLKYFAVRATEFIPSEIDVTDLVQAGIDLYQYPDALTLQNDIDAYAAAINVGNTNGYPEKGFLLVDTEILKYSVKDGTAFHVEDTERGAFTTFIDIHFVGAEVKLWHGIEETNTVIFQETAAWHKEWGIPRNVDEIGQLNVDSDGYREAAVDHLTTDLSVSDKNIDFPSYDYKGYHRQSLQATFSGGCVNSYVGGEFDGGRGLFLMDRNLARLDSMLQVTGEPVVLLRRKWTGKRCRCMGLRRENPRTRCSYCFSKKC
ncbi:hypothetical protein LCGC14_2088520 [marine sediment metagenome]|uniref:Uncharacterized protein n=1 Tax=marine sediment metagenome TaxID=412755 RepID=A0A0F9HAE8_9ZZZZ